MYPVYSIAKPFLAHAVLELALPLDASVGEFVPGLSSIYASRSIGQLLNHTSGLSDYSKLTDYGYAVANSLPAWSRDDLLVRTLALPHDIKGFSYSNIGYLLLRMAVENQTGKALFGALEQLVFKPLGIHGFEEWEQESSLVPNYDPKWVYSGTFLASERSILDGFAKLVQHRSAKAGLEVLSVEVDFEKTGFDYPTYGVGLMMDQAPSESQPKFVGHGGGGPGYSHMILMHVETSQTAIETSVKEFNQSEAITRLREKLTAKR